MFGALNNTNLLEIQKNKLLTLDSINSIRHDMVILNSARRRRRALVEMHIIESRYYH